MVRLSKSVLFSRIVSTLAVLRCRCCDKPEALVIEMSWTLHRFISQIRLLRAWFVESPSVLLKVHETKALCSNANEKI